MEFRVQQKNILRNETGASQRAAKYSKALGNISSP